MAGLTAAVRLREFGVDAVVVEKGERPGGSMLLSSGVIWRHRRFEDFRAECPTGDEVLQRLIWERLDDALDWLEALGAPVLARETGNPLTTGRRFDPRGLTEALVRQTGEIRFGTPLQDFAADSRKVVLATGGFPVRLAREFDQPLRCNPWSEGEGIEFAQAHGGWLIGARTEFYGRAMPDAPYGEADYVRLAQLYGRFAWIVNCVGERFFDGPVAWHENDLAQAIFRQPEGAAWYVLNEQALDERVRGRAVSDMVEAARAAGGTVIDPAELPFAAPDDA